jgi:hypothetical protein
MELFYVFNNWENATLGTGILFKPADDSVQNAMLNYWVNFANTGNPNGSGLTNWPQYQSLTDCYLEIKATPDGTQCGLLTAKSDLWDNVAGFTGCSSTVGIEDFIIQSNKLIIYPNPANSFINVECKNGFEIYNSIGQVIKQCSQATTQINISELPNGLYILKTDNQVGRLIKTE